MTGRRLGVLVASDRFPDEPKLADLRCPSSDVTGLGEVLAAEDLGGFADLHILKNRRHHEVLRKINEVLRKAEKDDFVLIYYSGHGKLDEAGRLHLATADTEVSYLESTSVPVRSIRDYLDVSRTTKTALILDCCFSGAVEKAFLRGDVDDQLNIASRVRGTFIMTASTGLQTAKEKEGDQYGVFTKHIIEGVRGGEADYDKDGFVSMNEIYRYVHDKVPGDSHQEPMRWGLNVRGELILSKSGRPASARDRRTIRDVLSDLTQQSVLPEPILSRAREIADIPPDGLDTESTRYHRLLDDLRSGELKVGQFISAWYTLDEERRAQPEERADEASASVAEPPDVSERPEPAAAVQVRTRAPALPLPTSPVTGEERKDVNAESRAGRNGSMGESPIAWAREAHWGLVFLAWLGTNAALFAALINATPDEHGSRLILAPLAITTGCTILLVRRGEVMGAELFTYAAFIGFLVWWYPLLFIEVTYWDRVVSGSLSVGEYRTFRQAVRVPGLIAGVITGVGMWHWWRKRLRRPSDSV